jgi:hypothetical protein
MQTKLKLLQQQKLILYVIAIPHPMHWHTMNIAGMSHNMK